jgi:hypothetical protein
VFFLLKEVEMTVDSKTMDDSLAVWPSPKVKENYEKIRAAETNYGTVEDQKAQPFITLYYKFLHKIFYFIRETKDMSGVLGERGKHDLYSNVYRRIHDLYYRNDKLFDRICLTRCKDEDWPVMKVKILRELNEILSIIDKAIVMRLIMIQRLNTSQNPLGIFDNLCSDTRMLIADQIKKDIC